MRPHMSGEPMGLCFCLARETRGRLLCPRVMRVSVGKSVCILSAAAVIAHLFLRKTSSSPRASVAQTERVAPEKASSEPSKIESEKHLSSPTQPNLSRQVRLPNQNRPDGQTAIPNFAAQN